MYTLASTKINLDKISEVGRVFKGSNGKYKFKVWLSGNVVQSADYKTESAANSKRNDLISEANL